MSAHAHYSGLIMKVIKMTDIKTFRIPKQFKGTDDLYRYLMRNVKFIGQLMSIRIQKPMKSRPFFVIGREKITEKNILFFASKSEFPENMNELISVADSFGVEVIVFFIEKSKKAHLESLDWLQRICNEGTPVVVGEVDF